MKGMKKLFLSGLVLAVVACGLEEVGKRPQGGKGDVWTKPGGAEGSADSDKTIIYITAFDYPSGYDWRADTEKGTVKCSLVVYADGVPMMKVPVGDDYEVSSDSDMHRMKRGHLYTDYSTDSETIIKKDGKEMIRYAGREMICDLQVDNGDVYTLGHNRDGDGFAYRRNGEVVLSREKGRTFGRFYDGADSCIRFAFVEPVEAVGKTLERYYVSVDGTVSQTAVREDVKQVWDIAFYSGEVCYLSS